MKLIFCSVWIRQLQLYFVSCLQDVTLPTFLLSMYLCLWIWSDCLYVVGSFLSANPVWIGAFNPLKFNVTIEKVGLQLPFPYFFICLTSLFPPCFFMTFPLYWVDIFCLPFKYSCSLSYCVWVIFVVAALRVETGIFTHSRVTETISTPCKTWLLSSLIPPPPLPCFFLQIVRCVVTSSPQLETFVALWDYLPNTQGRGDTSKHVFSCPLRLSVWPPLFPTRGPVTVSGVLSSAPRVVCSCLWLLSINCLRFAYFALISPSFLKDFFLGGADTDFCSQSCPWDLS